MTQGTTLLSEVAERIKTADVKERLITSLVEVEVANRVKLLEAAFASHKEAEKLVKKAERPDVTTYDVEGKVVSSSFSEKAHEELKKAQAKEKSLSDAIEKALEGDFSKLKNLPKEAPKEVTK